MRGIRVFELAKELAITNTDMMSALADLGVEVDGSSSFIDEQTAQLIREVVSQDSDTLKKGRIIEVGPTVTVRELAELMGVEPADVQKRLVEMGVLASLNQQLDSAAAAKVAKRFAYEVKVVQKRELQQERAKIATQPQPKHGLKLMPRPPVVTIMGHVDHGKTTLLDAIRQTNVTAQEFGGITQHIGAYQAEVNGRKITFLDTPGHEAFTAMRARGAQITDIAVLVIAADDAVMPQTIEAIDHAKAAGVTIIIAINKIDKPDANVDRVKQQLAEHNLVPEDWGGDTIMVEVSAKLKQNLEALLEMILLVADLQELKAEVSTSHVSGTVVEAKVDRGKGPVATVLIEKGTLKIGTPVVAGEAYGRIKAMIDDKGERVNKATPAMPVEILGLSQAPAAGDRLESVKGDREARQIAEGRAMESRQEKMGVESRVTLEDLYKQIRDGRVKDLNIILKADVQGSEEAVRQSLEGIEHEEVRARVIHSGVGNISESDILLASASNAVVIGFNVKADMQAEAKSEAEHVEIRHYNVIYELLSDVRGAMAGLLEPVFEEVPLGKAEVRAIFRVPKIGAVAGCYVTEGLVRRGAEIRVRRGNDLVFTGKADSLKHLKDDAREMAAGFECGIGSDQYQDFQIGDIIEVFTQKQVARAI